MLLSLYRCLNTEECSDTAHDTAVVLDAVRCCMSRFFSFLGLNFLTTNFSVRALELFLKKFNRGESSFGGTSRELYTDTAHVVYSSDQGSSIRADNPKNSSCNTECGYISRSCSTREQWELFQDTDKSRPFRAKVSPLLRKPTDCGQSVTFLKSSEYAQSQLDASSFL